MQNHYSQYGGVSDLSPVSPQKFFPGPELEDSSHQPKSSFNNPKYAPIRPDLEKVGFGSHVSGLLGAEDPKLKAMKQKNYYNELTRQIQERKSQVDKDFGMRSKTPADFLSFSSNQLAKEIRDINQATKETNIPNIPPVSNVPRYQKKHEIENHANLYSSGYASNGILQRDEQALLKQKKELQQREMQEALLAQIEEKRRKQEEHKVYERRREIRNEERMGIGSFEDRSPEINSPGLKLERYISSDENIPFNHFTEKNSTFVSENHIRVSSMPMSEPSIMPTNTFRMNSTPIVELDPNNENYEQLNQICQKLMMEQQELKDKLVSQEGLIEELKMKSNRPAAQLPTKTAPEPTRPRRPHSLKINTKSKSVLTKEKSNLKSQHDIQSAKIQAIEQKIENARKRVDVNKRPLKGGPKIRRISNLPNDRKGPESSLSRDSRSKEGTRSRDSLNHSPIPIRQQSAFVNRLPPTSPLIIPSTSPNIISHKKPKDLFERDNLDSAGESRFIYPTSDGVFMVEDELDRFIKENNIGSPIIPVRESISSIDDKFLPTSKQSKFPREVFGYAKR